VLASGHGAGHVRSLICTFYVRLAAASHTWDRFKVQVTRRARC